MVAAKNAVRLHAGSGGVLVEPPSADPVRELGSEAAARHIVAYLNANGQTDSFDLATALDLDPEFVETLCAELAMNGQIAER